MLVQRQVSYFLANDWYTVHALICTHVNSFQFSAIYVLNGIGGRLDQTLANMNTLYSEDSASDMSLYLMSEDSLSFVLNPVSL